MKIRKEIFGVALIGFTAICMDCHPSQKSMDTAQVNVDTSISGKPLLETLWESGSWKIFPDLYNDNVGNIYRIWLFDFPGISWH